jgi:ABC-type antimicrobial peptide transport system permease subunit
VRWSLKKSLGDTVPYVDERGRPFEVRIVATLADSILQGDLLISDANFEALFPSSSGRRLFLIDAPTNPPGRLDEVALTLGRGLRDLGLEIEPTAARLERFHAVQNTYLSIFAALGALGLLLGSAGLAVVVLRNVSERRGELALLSALGFRPRAVRALVLSEHTLLLTLGIVAGAAPALVAVLPAVRASGGEISLTPLLAILLAVTLTGLAWTWLATRIASGGNPIAALRND